MIAGDIVRVGSGVAHGEFVAIVDHISVNGQLYVIPIDGSSYSPKYLNEQPVKAIPEDRWTDAQFAAYAKWRDAKGIKPTNPS